MKYKLPLLMTVLVLVLSFSGKAMADDMVNTTKEKADKKVKTIYPVFLVHGAWGFDKILGFEYFSNDYGVFVGKSCTGRDKKNCNPHLNPSQKVIALSIHTVQSSEYRGLEIADLIENYMAMNNYDYVNLIGHALGGVCIRKAAKILSDRFGYPVVQVLLSINSPHRGTPVVKTLIDENPDIDDYLAGVLGDVFYEEGNDGYASVTSMIYDDYDPNDGLVTGSKAFNTQYPVSAEYAGHFGSVICAQNDDLSPFVASFNTTIDADCHCVDDCDGDGAAGCGDGDPNNRDDDGFVGINSQQMGYRLNYETFPLQRGNVTNDPDLGYVDDINYPDPQQMTSLQSVLNQDHFDTAGYGPDELDEFDFYAALFEYISHHESLSDDE